MSKQRTIKKIPIRGLNLKDSKYAVEPGYCETVNNLAYREGRWRSVNGFSIYKQFPQSDYIVRYRHNVLPEDHFIAIKQGVIYVIKFKEDNLINVVQNVLIINDTEELNISSFNNFLVVKYIETGVQKQKIFEYSTTGYTLVEVDNMHTPIPSITYEYYTPPKADNIDHALRIATVTCGVDESDRHNLEKKYVNSMDKRYETLYANLNKSGYMHGAICLMVAIKLKNGYIVRNGPLIMTNAEKNAQRDTKTLYRREDTLGPHIYNFYKNIYGFIPLLTFSADSLSALRNNPYVESLVVFSTRDTPIYNFESIFYDFPRRTGEYEFSNINGYMTSIVKSNYVIDKRNLDLANNPLYKIAEVKLNQSETDEVKLRLTYHNHYKDIEQKTIFTPMSTLHKMAARSTMAVNQRLHAWNISMEAFEGYDILSHLNSVNIGDNTYNKSTSEDAGFVAFVYMNINGRECVMKKQMINVKPWVLSGNTQKFYLMLPNMVTYPDSRAYKIDIYTSSSSFGGYKKVASRSLRPAPANDYAFCLDINCDSLMNIIPIEIFKQTQSTDTEPLVNSRFDVLDKLYVSEARVPYIFPPSNIYKIGDDESCEIVDINTPTDQLTETRFGEYPIYVFTTRGIFAMEQGIDTVLYKSIVKINNDQTVLKSCTMSARGVIFYFSKNGLKRLSGNTGVEMFDGINNELQRYVVGSKMLYLPVYDELLVYNKYFDYAYVYSLKTGVWSSRNMKGELIDFDKFIDINARTIYCYTESEDPTSKLLTSVTTREIALGEQWAARLEVLKVNFERHLNVTVKCLASNDGVKWSEIGVCDTNGRLRRTKASWRYFKFNIEGLDLAIDDFLVEYYTRFVNHL